MIKSGMLSRLKAILDKVLGTVVAALLGLLVLTVVWQVVSRYVLQDPSSATDELSRYLLIWVALLGAAYATGQHIHLAIDIFKDKINTRFANIFTNTIIIAFAVAALVVGGSRLVQLTLTLGQKSAALQLPLGYIYLVLPLSGILIALYGLIHIFQPRIDPTWK